MAICIIGGKYKGRKITVPDVQGLRPTTNRVRETLFNWLQLDITQYATLDLFSGSGLLSFEAISRGAKSATLLEKNRDAFLNLQKTTTFFPDESIKLLKTDALQFIKKNDLTKYDLLFVDPPFQTELLKKTLLEIASKIKKNTLLYLESESPHPSFPFESECLKMKRAGQVYYGLYRFIANSQSKPD